MTKLTKAQKRRIHAACRKFKREMQDMIDKSKGGVTGMSMQVGNRPPVLIAGKPESNDKPGAGEQ